MKLGIYTIYDKAAEQAGPLTSLKTDMVSIRYINGLIKSNGLNPLDYELLKLGEFDDESLNIIPFTEPEYIDYQYPGDKTAGELRPVALPLTQEQING